MQHEALGSGFAGLEQLDALLVVLGAQRDGHQRLGLAAGEQRRAVRARQDAGFDGDGTDLVEGAAIRTAMILDHLVAEDALPERLEALGGFRLLLFGLGFHHALLQGRHQRVAFGLVVLFGIQGVGQLRADFLRDLVVEGLVERRRRELAFGLARQLHQLANAGRDLLAALVAELDGAEDLRFGDLLRAGFHHHDAVFGAGDHDVQLGFAALGVGGVGQVLAVFHAHANAGQHVGEGDIGNGQRGGRADDRQGVGILLGIGRKDHGDDLGFVQEPFGKQRPDRTIDQAAGENFFFGGTPLAFDKAARDLAGGVGVLAVVNGEREKTGSRFGLVGHTSGDQDHRVTGANDNGAVRLFGHLTGFKGNLAAIQIDFNCVQHSSLKTSNLGREPVPASHD